jgi:chemotaxis protein CheY-P-specific phosphatase CheC
MPGVFGSPERLAIGVYARVVGDISGGILFIAEREAALCFVDMLRGRPVGTTVAHSMEDEALLSHASSVLIAAYLAAIARLADVHVLPAQQSYACDMAGALLQAAFANTEDRAEEAIMLRTALVEEACAADVALFFLPDSDSLAVLLGRLGVV